MGTLGAVETVADDIVLVEYDASWPSRFEAEAAAIRAVLGDAVAAIEHVGSTAVPGLAAKPIIDIDLTLRETADREPAIAALEGLGYSYWRANPKPDHMFFVKGMPPFGTGRTHHVHVFDSPDVRRDRVLFRDYLRAHPDEVRRYEALKRDLAARFRDDREAYTDSKGAYIAAVLAQARGPA